MIVKDVKIKCQECDFTVKGMGVVERDWENKEYFMRCDTIPEVLEHTDKTGHKSIVVTIPINQQDMT